ncbi:diguanylate cyclase [Candidatus Caldatribacterium sp. SIUC1]|uniref:diguanylate cyclase n=1 Tax=Candidatus Caldatribacterium sp. SIUC1 TaxID=3418365 RepID=UPI003F692DA8
MSLRYRVVAIVGVVSLVSFFLTAFALRHILVREFLALERENLTKRVEQLLHLVEGEKKNLERIVVDWALWDDTYRFMEGEYPEYVEVNCTDDIFPNLGIHFLGFFREDGTLVYGKSLDPYTQRPFALPQGFIPSVRSLGGLLSRGYLLDRKSGFFPVGKETWFFAISWILRSNLSGPPRGFLVMARKVDEGFLAHLSDLFGSSVKLGALDSSLSETFTVREIAPFRVLVSVPVSYAVGSGGIILVFPYFQSFAERGQRVAVFLERAHGAGSVAVLALLLLLLEGVVVRRILYLAAFLRKVWESRDFTLRAETKGKDEVTLLGGAVNTLLEEVVARSRSLEESETRFRRLFEGVPVGVYQARLGGEVLQANPRMLEIVECQTLGELQELGLAFFRQDAILTLASFEELLKRDRAIRGVVTTWRTKTGTLRFLRENAHLVRDEVYEGTLEDVTEEILARESVRKNEMYYRILLEYSSDAVLVLERDGRVRFATSSVENVTGYTPEELQGALALSFLHPEDARQVQHLFLQGKEGEVRRVEFRLKHRSGEWRVMEAIGRVLLAHPLIQGVVVTVRDVTERKRAEEAVRLASFRDVLTGLYNRAYFEEELDRLNTARVLPLSLIVGDVNGLKIVNDAFGHAEGDRLLRMVAEAFRASCRKEDVVARWGGDEFAVILPKADAPVASEICARIQERLKGETSVLPVDVALGWAIRESLSQSLEDVVREAEERMYQVKLAGRERFYEGVLQSFGAFLEELLGKRYLEEMEKLVLRFARRLRLSESQREQLVLLARFHEIGVIPLARRGEWPGLDQEAFLRRHTESGYFIASNIPRLAPLSEAILAHHEWWNGEGVPRGLQGEEIPLLSRIVALCTAFLEQPFAQAVAHIQRESGRVFDPLLAREFLTMVREHPSENGARCI